MQCLSNTAKNLKERILCKHPTEFAAECIYCNIYTVDRYGNDVKVNEARAKYLCWIKEFLRFNNIEYQHLSKEIEKLIIVSSNYPKFFMNSSNPNIASFIKNVDVIYSKDS